MRRRYAVVATLNGQKQVAEDFDTFWLRKSADKAAAKWNKDVAKEGIDPAELNYSVEKA